MKELLLALPLVFAGIQAPATAATMMPGTQIQVRADSPIDVSRWDRGRIYTGRVAQDVYARDGDLAIRRDSPAELIVRQLGPNQFVLDLESVTVNGQRYVVDVSGPQFNMSTDAYNNGAGIVANIVGAIAGVETRGSEIRVPGGSILNFQLQQPLHVVSWHDEGYENGGYHYHRFEDHGWYR